MDRGPRALLSIFAYIGRSCVALAVFVRLSDQELDKVQPYVADVAGHSADLEGTCRG